MGDYVNAKATAVDVINTSGFSVVTAANYATYWKSAVPRTDKVETLFEVTSDLTNNAGTDALAYIYSQAGYGDMVAAHDFYNSFAAGDVRTSYLVSKFRGGENAWTVEKYSNANSTSDRDDVKILRMSEVYLTAAEASYKTGSETDAKTYLDYIATRRVTGFTGYTATGSPLLDSILTERKKELAFEGDRLHTLNRLKLPINRGTDYPASARNIAYWDYRRILAIPLEEMQANPNMEQNEGYK
jgi:starch-binding outer membrane protein, SusD/RagB family